MFNGGAQTEAADKNKALYSQYGTDGKGYLNTGLDKSIGAIGTGYGTANSTIADNKNVYADYNSAATGALNTGLNNQVGAYAGAGASYNPVGNLATKYGAGTNTYLDSLGVNGAAGNARAVDSFHAGPSYNWTVDQGYQGLARANAAGGMGASGNALLEAQKYGQNQANQEYGNWQTRLSGLVNPELSATTGAAAGNAAAYNNIGNAYGTNATNLANVAGTTATGLANTNSAIASNNVNQGTQNAQLYTNNASDLTNLAGSVTSGNAAANNSEAAGKSQGASNLLNLGTNIAKLAAGVATGGASTAAEAALSAASNSGDGSWYGKSSLNGARLS